MIEEMIDELSPEEYEQMMQEKLQIFGTRLQKLATEQSANRNEIEQRWLKDLRQYHGRYTADEEAAMAKAGGSQVFVNITRNKSNGAEARTQDLLFPTDDRNWGIKHSPLPELANVTLGMMDQQGNDLGQVASDIEKQAVDAAEAMQTQIDDQLNEALYSAKARDIIHDAVQLGTGIVKGPVIVGRIKKQWETLPDGTSLLQITEDLAPSVERVDPWDFYPDMSARTIAEAEFIFERRRMSKRQLREFAKLPGVMTDQIRQLVRADARTTHLTQDHLDDIRNITGVNTVGQGSHYEIWEYHGPISKEELQCTGMFEEEELDELNDEVEGIVFFSANRVLKVSLNVLETEDRPYSVFSWEKDESSIFGFGVPALMRQAQKVINAAWRMMMDNAGMSVADQIVMNRELVQPADGSWQMTPKKMWWLRDKTRSVQEVFATFSTPSHQNELSNIFMMARQLADEETNLPLIAQGEQASNVTKTSSGMAMLMNSANIVLRRAVKNWDDDITRPLITRFYDWNMQFTDRAEIKGDHIIDARGSGALLVKEKQQENLMILAQLSANNPEFAMRVDWGGLYREIVKTLEVPEYNVTLTDTEYEEKMQQMAQQAQEQGEGGDPAMQVKMAELQLRAQQQQAEMQMKQQQMQMDWQLAEAKLMQDRELRMADLAARENLTIAQLQAKTGIEQQKDMTAREKAAADIALARAQQQLKAQNQAMGYDTFG